MFVGPEASDAFWRHHLGDLRLMTEGHGDGTPERAPDSGRVPADNGSAGNSGTREKANSPGLPPGGAPPGTAPQGKTASTVAKTLEEPAGPAGAGSQNPGRPAGSPSPAQTGAEAPPAKPKQNVMKTMFDKTIAKLLRSGDLPINPAGLPSAVQNGSAAAGQTGSSGAPEMPPPPPPSFKESQKAAKTMLDHSVLRDTVAKAAAEMEVKVAEQLKERANEPVKPFEAITGFKKSTPCSSVWENPDCKERFSYCQQCQLQVYDFTGMEPPEAEALILKRENRKNALLFQRADGKFLTTNCPVGVKKKQRLVITAVGGTLLVICVLGLLLMMPPPPKPAAAPAVVDQQQQQTPADDGETRWETDNQGRPAADTSGSRAAATSATSAAPQPAVKQNTQTGSTTSSSGGDENGQFWQYSNGDGQTVIPDASAPVTTPAYNPPQQAQQPLQVNQPEQPAQNSGGSQPAASGGQSSQPHGVKYYGR